MAYWARWNESTTRWAWRDDTGTLHPVYEYESTGDEPTPRRHNFIWYAGKLGTPSEIRFCCDCGLRLSEAPCVPVDLATKRIRMESAIHTAQLMNDVHAGFRALGNRPPATGPAYQNVSAVVRNVVGGWNRR